MAVDDAAMLELGKAPLMGTAPCGADAADDEQYIAVQDELNKVARIELGEPDWFVTEQNALNILKTKSKDVDIASGLGLALFKRHGYAGLAASLGMITEMIRGHWDGLFPERPRRRKSRIEGLAERFTEGGWFKDNAPKSNDFDALDLCVTRIGELTTLLTEKMADDPPDFAKFTRQLKELAARRPKPNEPAAPSGAGGAAPSAGGGAAFAAGEVADAGSAVTAILSACSFLRKANPADPFPYAIVRVIKWANIALPATEAARTQIAPPDNSILEALPFQMAGSLWDHLLSGAEGAFRAQDPLWLDLQRYVCAAMGGMGPNFEKARQAVMSQTAGLVKRLGEGLYELRFANGTPLCSGDTRMWIESELAPAQSAKGDGGASNGRLTEASTKARQLAGSGKLKEGLSELQDGLAACTQRRDRFLWRLRIAQLCFDAQRLQLAAPLLEECQEEVNRFHVDEWEPSLAVEVAQTLYRCRKALTSLEKDTSTESVKRVRDSYAWLCQLDPLAALAAEPGGP